MTSPSREAFEAHIHAKYKNQRVATLMLERMDGERYISKIIDYLWAGWQAAIQHASDVATAKCAEISEREHLDFKGLNPDAPPGKRGNSYVEGLSDGADLAGDAIKEALK